MRIDAQQPAQTLFRIVGVSRDGLAIDLPMPTPGRVRGIEIQLFPDDKTLTTLYRKYRADGTYVQWSETEPRSSH